MAEVLGYRFPGMDPWIEHPATWPGVHSRLITYLSDELASRIAPHYSARPGERLIVEKPGRHVVPDVVVMEKPARPEREATRSAAATLDAPVILKLPETWFREPFIEIRDRRSGNRVVTVIEVISPSNKRKGSEARRQYLQEQEELLASDVSLLEIDLLRGGEHTVAVPEEYLQDLGRPHYRIVTRRAGRPHEAEVWPIPLARRLPRLGVPLVAPDPDAIIDLQPLIERTYHAGGYAGDIDYAVDPDPPLAVEDLAWARDALARAVRR